MQDTLRFVTCGSVDDGKSTLIGRLLFESKQIFDDQLAAIEKDSRQYGTQGEAIDFSLLVDGLQAEREQRITIDVAYRFFSTPKRRFMVADTPGHEQFTRNMATGASTADLAVLLVDARKGFLTQTYRHSRIVAMLGVRHVVLAVNKMDLVGWKEDVFQGIRNHIEVLALELKFQSVQSIPLSALTGSNVTIHDDVSPWYTGPTLLEYLENISLENARSSTPFRMPVQWVNRPNSEFRGYCGRVAAGTVRVGDRICVVPANTEARIKSVIVWQGDEPAASLGESITLTLDSDLDISRGDVIAAANDPLEVSDQFEARILCLSENQLVPGRPYLFKLHTCQVVATITEVKYRLDVNQGKRLAAKTLTLNEMGVVTLSTQRPVPFAPYDNCKTLGAFILIDRANNETAGAGMIEFALRRASNIHWQLVDVDKAARARLNLHKSACLWLTGLSGSGKSTIANLLEKRLYAEGRHTYLLDGDNVRHGLNRDLGFTEADRVENIRRVAEVAKLMTDAGLIVVVSFISPFRAEREFARSLFEPGEFHEIFVDTPFSICEKRDPKGLYAKARRGDLKNFTGIDSPYEPPGAPEVRLDTFAMTPEECVGRILVALKFSEVNGHLLRVLTADYGDLPYSNLIA
jgi:bifunctional enzyme CysN/CysC